MRRLPVVVVLACALLAACGPPLVSTHSSRAAASQILLARCTRIPPAASGPVEGRLWRDDRVGDGLRFDFTAVPDGFFDDRRNLLRFVAWREIGPGRREPKPTAVRLFFVHAATGAVLRATPIDRIAANTIDAAIGMGHLDPEQYNHKTFLRTHGVMLTGLDGQWQGVTLEVRRRDGSLVTFDALLPPFPASPVEFGRSGVPPDLMALHPLSAIIESRLSDSEYATRADRACR